MTISTMYDFGMAKYVYVQMKGIEAPARVTADKAEDVMVRKALILKNGDNQVGQFNLDEVAGWWIVDTGDRD